MEAGPLELPHALRQWIKKQEFVFAKTMPENPHHYIVEKKHGGPEFSEFVEFVKQRGKVGRFRGYPYRYVEIDLFTYWLTFGRDAGWIINRKPTLEAGWDE